MIAVGWCAKDRQEEEEVVLLYYVLRKRGEEGGGVVFHYYYYAVRVVYCVKSRLLCQNSAVSMLFYIYTW